jgi:ketosteroid isomerase-like protein
VFSAAADLVGRMLGAFQARDLDRFLELLDPEVEVEPIVGSELAGTVYRGHDGIRDWWDNYFARFPKVNISLEEVRDLGDRVLTASRFHDEDGGGAGQPDLVVWTVAELRDSKILSWRSYRNEAEALDSVGHAE